MQNTKLEKCDEAQEDTSVMLEMFLHWIPQDLKNVGIPFGASQCHYFQG